MTAGLAPVRQLTRARELSREHPEVEIKAMDAKWYRLARYDSAIVSMNDGASAALYQRDPEKFRELATKTIEIHERLRREWPRLAQEYRAALGDDHLAGDLGADLPAVDAGGRRARGR